jgi:hypothetical protein
VARPENGHGTFRPFRNGLAGGAERSAATGNSRRNGWAFRSGGPERRGLFRPTGRGWPGAAGCGLMVAMVEPSGTEQSEPTEGWALLRALVRDFIDERRNPQPFAVRYLRCDGCGHVTPHTCDQRLYTIHVAEREMTAPPPEAVCDECEHAQPRTVGDEIPAEVTVTCVGRRHRRFGFKRSRRRCGREFAVPAAASSVLCPWCVTTQPGPRPAANP